MIRTIAISPDALPRTQVLRRWCGNDRRCGSSFRRYAGFKALVRERSALRLILSAIVILTYFSFILLVAFAPSSLGTPVTANSVVSVGIALGVGLILLSVVLTAIYVWRANKRFEALTQQVLKGLNK